MHLSGLVTVSNFEFSQKNTSLYVCTVVESVDIKWAFLVCPTQETKPGREGNICDWPLPAKTQSRPKRFDQES